MSEKVFVYGTLRTGDSRYGVTSFEGMLAPEAYIDGFAMLDLGGFPGLIEANEGRVRGEVHEYAHMKILDGIEGYNSAKPELGMYDRIQVTVLIPDGPDQDDPSIENSCGTIENCWVYIYNVGGRMSPVIESGDWFEHRGLYEKLAGLAGA